MATQITKNNHYVPPFLTKPWEREGKKLKLFNFETNGFETADSKTCFSAHEPYPKEIETFLHDVIEKPMNDLRPLLQKGEDALQQARFSRAASLLVGLQRSRNRAMTDAAFLKVLIELSQQSKEQLDTPGSEQEQGISIVRARGGARPLFFPSTGSFVVLGKDFQWNGKPIAAWAIPIDLERVLVSYNLGLNAEPSTKEGIRNAVESSCGELLEQASVGTDTATRVVIPAAMKDSEDDLASLLSEARRANRQAILDYNAQISALAKSGSEN